jgi:hypothetical protein
MELRLHNMDVARLEKHYEALRNEFWNLSSPLVKDELVAVAKRDLQLNAKGEVRQRVSEKLPCFVAGTLVHTKDGEKPIEEIRVGDWVLSYPDDQVPPLRWREERGERWFIPRQEDNFPRRHGRKRFSRHCRRRKGRVGSGSLPATSSTSWTLGQTSRQFRGSSPSICGYDVRLTIHPSIDVHVQISRICCSRAWSWPCVRVGYRGGSDMHARYFLVRCACGNPRTDHGGNGCGFASGWTVQSHGCHPRRNATGSVLWRLPRQWAKAAGVSQDQLIRRFKREVGLTPHRFLLQNRIRKAQRLIERGMPIAEWNYEIRPIQS